MSEVEKTRRNVERSAGKFLMRHQGSIVMKKSGRVIYNRRPKEECQQPDAERDRSHSAASSGDRQSQPEQELNQSIQPGTVRRLVEKFRSLGESAFNSKPTNRNVPSKRLSGSLMEGFAILRKKPDRVKKSRTTEEKWILLTPSLFSPHELDSCSVSLSQPTSPAIHRQEPSHPAIHRQEPSHPVIHHQEPSHPAIHIDHKVDESQEIVLGCEHDESEIMLPIECITIDNPADINKRITIGACKDYSPNDKADDKQVNEEMKTIETADCHDTNYVISDETRKEDCEYIDMQKDLVVVNNDEHYEEIEVQPPKEVCCAPSQVVPIKESVYEDIDVDVIPNHSEVLNHSDAANVTGKGSKTADHTSKSAENFECDESIYEEIDLSPPMIVVREQNSLSSSSFRSSDDTLNINKSEHLSVPGSQHENFGSSSSVFDESSSAESVISDLDDYDIVYISEILGLEFSRTNSVTSNSDLEGVHRNRSFQKSTQSSSTSVCEICRKPRNKSCQCHEVPSTTTKNSESKINKEETASGSNDEENIYENYEFPSAIVLREGNANNNKKHCETGCHHERGLSTDAASESSSRNSCSSSSYESFSSDDEYEYATDDCGVLMQRAEEPRSDSSSTEEPVTKLDRIIHEIVETERKYIERLKLINDEFRVAVTTWNQEKNYIPVDVLRQIFLNIDVIYKLHSGFFLPELEACINKENRRKIEDVFLKGADFLKLYAEYSCNFSTSMRLIELWKIKVPEFSRFIHGIQQKPVCQSLTLEHHMLEPILRIPRYELLLNKYLENLPEDSHEREKSLKAVQKVTAAASHCNDFITSMEKYRKVMDVQQSLWSKVALMTPSRELIMEGRLKVTQQQCIDEDKHLFLFNDTLLVCKIFPLGITPPYKLTLQLDIDGMQVVDRQKEEVVETFFVISKQGYLEMHPGSKEEKEKWISALNGVITKYMALEKSRRNAAVIRNSVNNKLSYTRQKSIPGTQAPIWIKDPQANRCMQCDEKFNAIKRRHHCRACGIVVCGKCSSKEASLAFDNFSRQHRVCDKCFSEISSSTKDDNESETKTSHSLVRNVARSSRRDAADSDRGRTSVFFILPSDDHSPNQLKSKDEQTTVAEPTSRLDAIIETDAESKDSQSEKVT